MIIIETFEYHLERCKFSKQSKIQTYKIFIDSYSDTIKDSFRLAYNVLLLLGNPYFVDSYNLLCPYSSSCSIRTQYPSTCVSNIRIVLFNNSTAFLNKHALLGCAERIFLEYMLTFIQRLIRTCSSEIFLSIRFFIYYSRGHVHTHTHLSLIHI